MSFSFLSDTTRESLEQERARLQNQRDSIIQSAVDQATAEIDQTLQQINHLLGNDTTAATTVSNKKAASSKKTTASVPAKKAQPTNKETAEPATTKRKATISKEASAPQKVGKKAKPAATGAKVAAKATESSPLLLKKDFKSSTPTEAVRQILEKADKPMSTDEVIQSIYQSVKEPDRAAARRSVGLILGRGTHQNLYEKLEENPPRYQLKA